MVMCISCSMPGSRNGKPRQTKASRRTAYAAQSSPARPTFHSSRLNCAIGCHDPSDVHHYRLTFSFHSLSLPLIIIVTCCCVSACLQGCLRNVSTSTICPFLTLTLRALDFPSAPTSLLLPRHYILCAAQAHSIPCTRLPSPPSFLVS